MILRFLSLLCLFKIVDGRCRGCCSGYSSDSLSCNFFAGLSTTDFTLSIPDARCCSSDNRYWYGVKVTHGLNSWVSVNLSKTRISNYYDLGLEVWAYGSNDLCRVGNDHLQQDIKFLGSKDSPSTSSQAIRVFFPITFQYLCVYLTFYTFNCQLDTESVIAGNTKLIYSDCPICPPGQQPSCVDDGYKYICSNGECFKQVVPKVTCQSLQPSCDQVGYVSSCNQSNCFNTLVPKIDCPTSIPATYNSNGLIYDCVDHICVSRQTDKLDCGSIIATCDKSGVLSNVINGLCQTQSVPKIPCDSLQATCDSPGVTSLCVNSTCQQEAIIKNCNCLLDSDCPTEIQPTCSTKGSKFRCLNRVCTSIDSPKLVCDECNSSPCANDTIATCSQSGTSSACVNGKCVITNIPAGCSQLTKGTTEITYSAIGIAITVVTSLVGVLWWAYKRKVKKDDEKARASTIQLNRM